jgi:hypothetical protein
MIALKPSPPKRQLKVAKDFKLRREGRTRKGIGIRMGRRIRVHEDV